MLPALARGATQPCPVPELRIDNNAAVTTTCEAGGPAPSWFASMPDRTWKAIATAGTIYSVRPPINIPGASGLTDVTNAWTGACADQRRGEYILPAQGGHNGYYGNEIYALALREENPAWRRIWGPTPVEQIPTSNLGYNPPNTHYADGSPRPVHGWFHQFVDRNGRIWMAPAAPYANPNGDWGTSVYSIDRENLGAGWMHHGRLYTAIPGGAPNSTFGYQSGPGAYDPIGHKIWRGAEFATQDGVASIDVAAAIAAGQQLNAGPKVPGSTIYNVALAPNPFANAWSVVTTNTSPRCWIVGAPNLSELWIMNLEGGAGTFTRKSTTGSPNGFTRGVGAVYHAPSRAILVGGSEYGADIRKLAINGTNPLTATYTWSQVSPGSGNSVAPTGNDQYRGTFSKFQMIEDMGNGQSAIVLVTTVTGPTYVYKLPPTV